MRTQPESVLPPPKRSVAARLVAVLSIAACCFAVYVVASEIISEEPAAGQEQSEASGGAGKQERPKSYTVAPNDTLSEIAEKTGVSEAKIRKFNPQLDPGAINVGRVLKLRR